MSSSYFVSIKKYDYYIWLYIYIFVIYYFKKYVDVLINLIYLDVASCGFFSWINFSLLHENKEQPNTMVISRQTILYMIETDY